MNLIIKSYRSIINISLRYFVWIKQSIEIRRNITKDEKVYVELKNKIIFILVPHADDEWIGCSQVLRKYGKNVYLCYLNIEKSDVIIDKARRKELITISEKHKNNFVDISGEPIQALYSLIKKLNPDYIFLPYFIDWHQDHLKVIDIFYDVSVLLESEGTQLYNHIFISMCQISVPIPPQVMNYGLSMSLIEWTRKWLMFLKIYKSQRTIPFFRFALQEFINGKKFNSLFSEVFTVLPLKVWQNEKKLHILTSTEISSLLENLQDIRKIRKISEDIKNRRV
ncbi:MAG: hypothetical protein JXR48_09220 [Candidatus Delongbacteria bacterium]|nr:hypothetical protein [Candidatus Delongbacteria bacterium]